MKHVKVRVAQKTWAELQAILFVGYPRKENATFLRCGWAEGKTSLVVTIKETIVPREGDVDGSIGKVTLNEAYSLRCALGSERGPFAPGLIHSHPEGGATYPSRIDDDMDDYFSDYFSGFAPERPYVSMIASRDKKGRLSFSGRVRFRGEWLVCSQLQIVGRESAITRAENVEPKAIPAEIEARLERMTGGIGVQTAQKLWRAKVGIVGAGGTGSALFHSLVRSCVGTLVIVDPDRVSYSNSERVHGFRRGDVEASVFKVEILKRLAAEINPAIEVIPLPIDATSEEAQRQLLECDFIFGCTDSQTGRVLVSDGSVRNIQPAVHINVSMESTGGRLTSQPIHLTRFGPGMPCAYCRQQVDGQRLAQETMSESERNTRRETQSASNAARGMYWIDEPVIHTIGSLTTIAAELAANLGVGLLAEAYDTLITFLEMDLLNLGGGAVEVPLKPRADCMCKDREGSADQIEPWLGRR